MKICEKHKCEMTIADCPRCRGDGYTETDLEAMDNPIEWHDGRCWQCKGTGSCGFECDWCELEAAELELLENL